MADRVSYVYKQMSEGVQLWAEKSGYRTDYLFRFTSTERARAVAKRYEETADPYILPSDTNWSRAYEVDTGKASVKNPEAKAAEDSGSHCQYYHCGVTRPQNPNQTAPYVANCEDIIQALGMTFDEGCEFKSLWRRARSRQGFKKAETTAVRDAAKALHYAQRVLAYEQSKEIK